jgi:calcineurin-like phosphoesterase family protein
MSNIFFTSDLHFGHKHIIEYCNRPWETVEQMDEGLIERWNSVVNDDDQIYILGDFSFRGKTRTLEILERLSGIKFWIRGNHDSSKIGQAAVEGGMVEWFRDYYRLRVHDGEETQKIVLCHFPIESWHGLSSGTWHLHGHCHGSLSSKGKRFDVGVDCHSWYPISYENVKRLMDTKSVHLVDHHGKGDM